MAERQRSIQQIQMDVDSHKLQYHPRRVADVLIEDKREAPIYVEVGLTDRCNARCIFCAVDYVLDSNKTFMNKEPFIAALRDMGQFGVKSILFAGEGESTLHPNFVEFIETARKSGMDVAVTTNGIPLNQKKLEAILPNLKWLRFSCASPSPYNFIKIEGLKDPKEFEQFRRNVRNSVLIKKAFNLPVVINIQFLLLPQNEHEILQMVDFAKGLEVDTLQIKPYSQHPLSNNKIPVDYSKYADLEEKLKQFNTETFKIIFRVQTMFRITQGIPYNQCEGIKFMALIDALGNIMPCNLHYKVPDRWYGNLNTQSFSEIWKSNRRQEVIRLINEVDGITHCRVGCRLDPINRYIWRIRHSDEHDNFI